MSSFKNIVILATSITVFGCTDTGEDTGSTNSATSINAYSVTGTSAQSNGVTPINSGVANGEFTVAWNVSSSDPYRVDLYLSNDAALSNDDYEFFGQNCGSLSYLYDCGSSANFNCRFTTQNKISCGTVSSFNRETDISAFLDQIPKRAFLILEACNGLFNDCKTSSVEIELQ